MRGGVRRAIILYTTLIRVWTYTDATAIRRCTMNEEHPREISIRYAMKFSKNVLFPSHLPYRTILLDPSLWLLLVSNSVAIYYAATEHLNVVTLLWIYWCQSIIIGFFNVVRILELKEFSTAGFTINGKSVAPTQGTKFYTAFFFLGHYGFFHVIYFSFLSLGAFVSTGHVRVPVAFEYVLYLAVLFFLNHLFSYYFNKTKDTKNQNIGALMFYPYVRIIPMHLTVILGSFFGSGLVLFMVLKTFADALMHVIEHAVLRKGEELSQSDDTP